MKNNNTIRIRGNLVRDPVINREKNFAVARVAVNFSGREKQETMYFEVKFFGDKLKDVDYFELKTGDRVVVDGSMAVESRTKDDKTYTDMVLYCETIEKIWRKQREDSDTPQEKAALSGKF